MTTPFAGSASIGAPSIVTTPVAVFAGAPAAFGGPALFAGPVSLPKAGAGGLAEGTSMNFLLLGSLVTAVYMLLAMVIRRASGRRVALENDGILGL